MREGGLLCSGQAGGHHSSSREFPQSSSLPTLAGKGGNMIDCEPAKQADYTVGQWWRPSGSLHNPELNSLIKPVCLLHDPFSEEE